MESDKEGGMHVHSDTVSAVLEPSVGMKPPEHGTYLDMDTLEPVGVSQNSVAPELLQSSSNGTVYPQVRPEKFILSKFQIFSGLRTRKSRIRGCTSSISTDSDQSFRTTSSCTKTKCLLAISDITSSSTSIYVPSYAKNDAASEYRYCSSASC